MKVIFKLFFLALFLGGTGMAFANTSNPIAEEIEEPKLSEDEDALRVRVCWTNKRGRRICVTVRIGNRRRLTSEEFSLDASITSEGRNRYLSLSGFPKELNDAKISFPAADSGFAVKEGKLYLKEGGYGVRNSRLKIPVVLKK